MMVHRYTEEYMDGAGRLQLNQGVSKLYREKINAAPGQV